MKQLFILVLSFFTITISAQSYRNVDNKAFDTGEKLTYDIAFSSLLTGNMTAGKLTLEVMPDKKTVTNRSAFHVVAQGNSTGFIEFFYKVNDRFESYIDEKAIVSLKFIQRKRENNYKKNDTMYFNQLERKAKSSQKEFDIPANAHDMVSALYFARTLEFDKIAKGSSFNIPFVIDDSVYHSKIIFIGRQIVKTKMGEFSCFAFKPMVATGKVFDQKYPMTFWVTDDSNHIPVLIESKLSVGKARIEITSCQGILKPIRNLALNR